MSHASFPGSHAAFRGREVLVLLMMAIVVAVVVFVVVVVIGDLARD